MSDTPTVHVQDVRLAYRLARNRAGTMKEYALRLLRRQLEYEKLWALDGVSFSVRAGETFGVVGPNGAGKTTLMKVISGVLQPTAGRVIVRGLVAPMIEIGGGLNVEMTARENVILYGTLLGRDPVALRKRIPAIIEWAGLGEFSDVPVRSFSSGMTARLAFAIATDVKPQVLVVDEVLAVGDEAFKAKSFARMADLMAGGTSVVLVSHALDRVKQLAGQALWLDRGRVKMLGDASEVVDAYKAAS